MCVLHYLHSLAVSYDGAFWEILSKSGYGSALLTMALVLASHVLCKDQQHLKPCILEGNRMVNNEGACSINIVMFRHLRLP